MTWRSITRYIKYKDDPFGYWGKDKVTGKLLKKKPKYPYQKITPMGKPIPYKPQNKK